MTSLHTIYGRQYRRTEAENCTFFVRPHYFSLSSILIMYLNCIILSISVVAVAGEFIDYC